MLLVDMEVLWDVEDVLIEVEVDCDVELVEMLVLVL